MKGSEKAANTEQFCIMPRESLLSGASPQSDCMNGTLTCSEPHSKIDMNPETYI